VAQLWGGRLRFDHYVVLPFGITDDQHSFPFEEGYYQLYPTVHNTTPLKSSGHRPQVTNPVQK
jgi:hypothetical protein